MRTPLAMGVASVGAALVGAGLAGGDLPAGGLVGVGLVGVDLVAAVLLPVGVLLMEAAADCATVAVLAGGTMATAGVGGAVGSVAG